MAKLRNMGYMPVKCMLMSITGFPDILVIGKNGFAFFIECKQPGKKPTVLQRYVHKQLRERGFDVYVIDSPDLPDEICGINAQ